MDRERVAAIEVLGESGAIWVVPHLARFLFASVPEARVAAGEACVVLLSGAGASEYLWLEHNFRSGTADDPQALRALQPREVHAQATASGRYSVACGLLSLHWNGHVREAAVRCLGSSGEAQAVPFLLLRLNDWVTQVRGAAKEALAACVASAGLEPLVLHLPLLARLERGARARAGGFVEEIRQMLLQQPAAVYAGLQSPDRAVRKECMRLAAAATRATREELIARGLASLDPAVQLLALPYALESAQPSRWLEPALAFLSSRLVPLRLAALDALSLLSPERSLEAARGALLDPCTSVRHLARWILSRAEEQGFAILYRQVLAEPPAGDRLIGALGGLGETGTKDDLAKVVPFLEHPRARVKKAAVRAAAKLAPLSQVSLFVPLLLSSSSRVSCEARRALEARIRFARPAEVRGWFGRASLPPARRNALRLIERLPTWHRLEGCLEITCRGGREPLAEEALALALRVLSRADLGFTRPEPEQRSRIWSFLAELEPRLPDGTLRMFEGVAPATPPQRHARA